MIQPELVIEDCVPILEIIDQREFSSLTQQLRKLCESLGNGSGNGGGGGGGAGGGAGGSSTITRVDVSSSSSSSMASPRRSAGFNDDDYAVPTGSEPLRSWRDPAKPASNVNARAASPETPLAVPKLAEPPRFGDRTREPMDLHPTMVS